MTPYVFLLSVHPNIAPRCGGGGGGGLSPLGPKLTTTCPQQEMNRLELQHMIWMELLGNRLYLAPLQKIHMTHALDVGCGTGSKAEPPPLGPSRGIFC